ncbi:MAG: hypothetical protein IJ299_00210 [Oscillospiraceae bacterium]|nr:hypothetical protein [Oscillospiraceae bacterium]
MVNCKKCKTAFNENYMNFCPNCGEVLPKEKNVNFNSEKRSGSPLSKLFAIFKKK